MYCFFPSAVKWIYWLIGCIGSLLMLTRGYLWVSGGTGPGVAFEVYAYVGFIGALLSGLSGGG